VYIAPLNKTQVYNKNAQDSKLIESSDKGGTHFNDLHSAEGIKNAIDKCIENSKFQMPLK